jgi:hypothetical protein
MPLANSPPGVRTRIGKDQRQSKQSDCRRDAKRTAFVSAPTQQTTSQQTTSKEIRDMRTLLFGTTVMVGLAGPVGAATLNSIAIDDGSGSVAALAIIQDDSSNTNTVSGDGASGAGSARLPISGPWNSIVINQIGAGNVLQTSAGGTIKSKAASTAASLTANYTTTSTGGNIHSLSIGKTTAPLDPSVVVFVKNNGASDNTVTDTLDGASLSYNLGLQGTGNALTNTVSAATGGITLTQGNSAYGVSGGYGIAGNSNTIVNTLTSTGGTVLASLMVNGNGNSLTNTVTTTGGAITLVQGGGGNGITGSSNIITNTIGGDTAVTSFEQTLAINGSGNTVVNTVDSAGDKVVDLLMSASSNNTIHTTVSGGGLQTASLVTSGSSYLNYSLTSAANNSYANIGLTGVSGVIATPAVVTVEQTSGASNATAILNVTGTGFTMGTLGNVPGTYSAAGAGVAVYQNSPGAYLNATVTAASNGYTAKFTQ